MGSGSRLPGNQSRARLLEAAQRSFLQHGYDGTTGTMIREAVGLSNGTWAHFMPGGKAQAAAIICLDLHASLWEPVLAELQARASWPPWENSRRSRQAAAGVA